MLWSGCVLSDLSSAAPGTTGLVNWPVDHFGSYWNISTSLWWIATRFFTHLHGHKTQRHKVKQVNILFLPNASYESHILHLNYSVINMKWLSCDLHALNHKDNAVSRTKCESVCSLMLDYYGDILTRKELIKILWNDRMKEMTAEAVTMGFCFVPCSLRDFSLRLPQLIYRCIEACLPPDWDHLFVARLWYKTEKIHTFANELLTVAIRQCPQSWF